MAFEVFRKTADRREQIERLSIRASQASRFLSARLRGEDIQEEEELRDLVHRILAWDRVLLATYRLLGASSEVFQDSEELEVASAA